MDYNRIFDYGLIGDPETKIYLRPDCLDYPKNESLEFAVFGSELQAKTSGFKISPQCLGR